jgi:hypothetical protein
MRELRRRVLAMAALLNLRKVHVSLRRNFVIAHSSSIHSIYLRLSLRGSCHFIAQNEF